MIIGIQSAPVSRAAQSGKRQTFQNKISFISNTDVRPLRRRIWDDWMRGIEERSLSASYRMTRKGVESILRDETREAIGRRVSAWPLRKAA